MNEENTLQLVLNTYRAILDELKFMKQQQWLVAYYSILIIGALFAFSHSDVGKSFNRSLAVCFAIFAGTYATVLLGLIQYDISRARIRADNILKSFAREQLQKIGLSDRQISEIKSVTFEGRCRQFLRGSEFLIGPIVVSWGAVALVIWSLQ